MQFIKRIFLVLIMGCLLIVPVGMWWSAPQLPIQEGTVQGAIKIPYKIDTIPQSNKRPGITRRVKSIVVHNTSNPSSTAQNERDYLVNPENASSTSFHIAVDDHEIIEAIPLNEIAFHALNSECNKDSIGIEICESGDYEKAEQNGVWIIAYLMHKYDIPLSEVKTHQECSGKECPRLILDHWGHFLDRVDNAYNELEGMID